LEAARKGEKFSADTLNEVENFLRAPREWQAARKK
jgi:hypothetical protein